MSPALAVSIVAVLLGLYYFIHGQRSKREDLGPVPAVTDDELFVLREMGTHGGARREMHDQRPSSGHLGSINSIWFGQTPIDYEQCRWLYDLMEKDLKNKGLTEQKAGRYSLVPFGERVLRANLRRKIKSPPTLIDAKTGRPRE